MQIIKPIFRDHFMQQVAADGAPYFWAGGRISSDKRSLSWENGRREGISQGRHPWSHTGSRGAQPDGRGSEDCLAILNNFYNVSNIAVQITHTEGQLQGIMPPITHRKCPSQEPI